MFGIIIEMFRVFHSKYNDNKAPNGIKISNKVKIFYLIILRISVNLKWPVVRSLLANWSSLRG